MNRIIKKKTITIGIPAYNEEANIGNLIKSLLKQKGNNFVIKKIIVACDGCTDNTVEVVRQLRKSNKIVTCISDNRRLGKNRRLNNLYANFKTDIFISFDADVEIRNTNIVSEIVKAFKSTDVALVGGRVLHSKAKSFIGSSIYAYEYFWLNVIDQINNGKNIHSHTGPVTAGTRSFLQNIKIPDGLPDDHYLYLKAMKERVGYNYAKNAVVFVKVPLTFSDYMKQQTRFIKSAGYIKQHFGEQIDKYYFIGRYIKTKAYLIAFRKYPVQLISALVLVTLQRILAYKYIDHNKSIWSQVQSSK